MWKKLCNRPPLALHVSGISDFDGREFISSMNLNESSFEDLLSEGVPVHVSARCMEERKAGAYKDWGDFHARLFYCQGSSGVKPAEGLLLRHIKGCFIPSSSSDSEATKTDSVGSGLKDSNVAQMSAGGVMSRGPWWDWPEQKEDDTFPAGKAAWLHAW